MNHQLAQAIKYWDYVAPAMKHPSNQKECDILINELDELLNIIGEDENHRLIGLADIISNLISYYEENHLPSINVSGVDALKFLMDVHHLSQSDLSEIGSQGVISEILQGKRKLNLRQIKLLAKRFNVAPATFIDD